MQTSVIAKSAQVAADVRLGEFCFIGEEVKIGVGCIIGSHVVIYPGALIGNNVRIDDGAVIGKQPMRAANSAVTKEQQLEPTRIGDNCIIGTYVVIYAGAVVGQKVLIADLSTVRENVSIGDFTIIGRGVAVENYCKIGSYCKLETNVYLTAYSDLADRVFMAPCVATSNDNFVGRTQERFKHFKGITVKRGGRVGLNSTILPGKVVGEDALVAAGSVLTKDAPDRKIVVGSPAKVVRDVPAEQLLENQ
jgi:UDP-2-acetamido-3-amino-2,3-dideoxy-glucuronate N-acetyltransferase